MSIQSEDGEMFHCHKCVLVARLEYFHSMLASGWMEVKRFVLLTAILAPSKALKSKVVFRLFLLLSLYENNPSIKVWYLWVFWAAIFLVHRVWVGLKST